MVAAAADSLRVRRSSPARRFTVFIAVLAFALQSYVTQTHVHGDAQGISEVIKITTSQVLGQHKAPANRAADCPLCQAVVHAGVFVASGALTLYLPFVWVKTVALVTITRASSHATAHDWQSRAPPRS